MLNNIVQNKIGKEFMKTAKSNPEDDDDFDPNITLDNLVNVPSSKSPHKGNIQSVQLAAKMVSFVIYYILCLHKYKCIIYRIL